MGYLVAGVAASPYSFGLVRDVGLIEAMASIGIVLLMFTLGMEFSLADLRRVGPVGVGGGAAQVLGTALFGLILGVFVLGWSTSDAVFLGFMIALSSTMIVLKILMENGEASSPHGKVLIGILLVQDLAVIPLLVFLPAIGQPSGELLPSVGLALGKAAAFLAATALIGYWAVPTLLRHVAASRSREVFLIAVLSISFGAAFSTTYFGVSPAFGAFAAGMLISRSEFAHQALSDMTPFRNVFAAMFFVSLGMLVNPVLIVENWRAVLLLTVAIIIGKLLISSGIVRLFGYGYKTVLLAGAGLAQVGEFSFVLGQTGLATGAFSSQSYSIVISAAILTMLSAPLAFKGAHVGSRILSARSRLSFGLFSAKDARLNNAAAPLANHVVVCCHGRSGSNITEVLRRYSIPYVVIELDPRIISRLAGEGVPCIYGDAGNDQILSLARIEKARVLAMTCPDLMAQTEAVAYSRQVNPRIDIIVRAPDGASLDLPGLAGASEVVEPAFEASLEFVRHILRYYGVPGTEVESIACPFLRERGQG